VKTAEPDTGSGRDQGLWWTVVRLPICLLYRHRQSLRRGPDFTAMLQPVFGEEGLRGVVK
jgi:hypothetical protein